MKRKENLEFVVQSLVIGGLILSLARNETNLIL